LQAAEVTRQLDDPESALVSKGDTVFLTSFQGCPAKPFMSVICNAIVIAINRLFKN
jgi:hypothetical protein